MYILSAAAFADFFLAARELSRIGTSGKWCYPIPLMLKTYVCEAYSVMFIIGFDCVEIVQGPV